MDTFKRQIETCQDLNVVLSEFFIKVLKFWFGFKFPLIVLRTLDTNETLFKSLNTEQSSVKSMGYVRRDIVTQCVMCWMHGTLK